MPPQRLPGWFAAASAVVAIAVYGLLVVAAARADDTVLTLDGPGATRLGHQVTFAGQLEPARSGVRVGVYLGSSVVGWANTRSDGVVGPATRARLQSPVSLVLRHASLGALCDPLYFYRGCALLSRRGCGLFANLDRIAIVR